MDDKQLSEIFKAEYSNLVAVLCHYYGVRDMQLAEDIVSDTFIKAMKSWSHTGIPQSPKAWLRKVAANQLTDHHRRKKTYEEKVIPKIDFLDEKEATTPSDEVIADSQLRMMFVVCDPVLNIESQLCIALRILCGFSIDEIAKALLSNKQTINKRLYRAKNTLKESNSMDTCLSTDEYVSRLDNVLRVIYLIFNEGYYSSIKEEAVRHELCWEAMRLGIFLSRQQDFPLHRVHALLALMCMHASRLNARTSGNDHYLLYEQQDPSLWNRQLIQKGEKYLSLASQGNVISKYHLEAAIAYWHTTDESDKWSNILQLYNRLLTIEYSPIIAMNRTYALAMADSVPDAIQEALKLQLDGNHFYYCLLAELYRLDADLGREAYYLNKALQSATKQHERDVILRKLGTVS